MAQSGGGEWNQRLSESKKNTKPHVAHCPLDHLVSMKIFYPSVQVGAITGNHQHCSAMFSRVGLVHVTLCEHEAFTANTEGRNYLAFTWMEAVVRLAPVRAL